MKNNNILASTLYPIEQSFKQPMMLTALLVLAPALVLFFVFGEGDISRAFKIFIGNWISPVILWFFAASFFHLWLKSKKLKQEQAHTQQLLKFYQNDTGEDASLENVTQFGKQKNIPEDNLLLSRTTLYLNHQGNDDIDEGFGIKEREFESVIGNQ